jgi:thiopeptide-type bacteriocin biosynthesis protein
MTDSIRVNNKRYQPLFKTLNWFVIRAPALPARYIADSLDSGTLRAKFNKAIAISSPSLFDTITSHEQPTRHLERTLSRYRRRMAGRPTPFGLFGGVGVAKWSDSTHLALAGDFLKIRTRPDMDFLLALVDQLESRREVVRELELFSNPSRTVRDDRVAVLGRHNGASGEFSTRLSATVAVALDACSCPVAYRDLLGLLVKRSPNVSEARIEEFIRELIRLQILLTSLRVPITSSNPGEHLRNVLQRIHAAEDVLEALDLIVRGASSFDADACADGKAFNRLALSAKRLAPTINGTGLQVDAALRFSGECLSSSIAAEAERAAHLLIRLNAAYTRYAWVTQFRHAFTDRYGSGRYVPLTDIDSITPSETTPNQTGLLGARNKQLLCLAATALNERQKQLELDEATISALGVEELQAEEAPISVDFAVIVCAKSCASIDSGDYRLLVSPMVGAHSAGRTLGRFADAVGDDAYRALASVAKAEQTICGEEAILADIVYYPDRTRAANIALRPNTREFEILVNAMSHRNALRQSIPIAELVLGVWDGKFVLKWIPHNLVVIPCVGHMLNHRDAPLSVRLLSDLMYDGRPSLSRFDWGTAEDFPFLPRVTSGRVILRPAQWRLPRKSVSSVDSFLTWRMTWDVPRHTYLVDEDNRLPVDLDDEAQVQDLLAEGRRDANNDLIIHEGIPWIEDAWLSSADGAHLSELVIPFVRRVAAQQATTGLAVAEPTNQSERLRPPGSEWLYFKLYCRESAQDDLLSLELLEFAEESIQTGSAESWFFLRYKEPEPHLRVRFRGENEQLRNILYPNVCTWAEELISRDKCFGLTFDTYDREIERYGGVRGIAIAEKLFAADSRAVAALLRLGPRDGAVGLDIALGVLGVDDLLRSAGMDETERLAWLEERATRTRGIGAMYRERKAELCGLLTRESDLPFDMRDIFDNRYAELGTAMEELIFGIQRGAVNRPLAILLESLVHMHCNRSLGAGSLKEPLVISLAARTRRTIFEKGKSMSAESRHRLCQLNILSENEDAARR